MPEGIEWLILFIIGLFTQFAQILLTKALHTGSASTITPIQYLGAIYMFLIGYFVFDDRLSFIVNIGMATILFGVFLNAIVRHRIVK
jgi:drug/metabolite transporter (DMT)-like permease